MQEPWKQFVHDLVGQLGFTSYNVEFDVENRRGSIVIYEHEEFVKRHAPALIESINYVFQLVAKKHDAPHVFFDVNNYRKERERLISELARGAARRVTATKDSLELPAMNSYERRIVHVELAMHPDVATESVGAGKERRVVVKPLDYSNGTA